MLVFLNKQTSFELAIEPNNATDSPMYSINANAIALNSNFITEKQLKNLF